MFSPAEFKTRKLFNFLYLILQPNLRQQQLINRIRQLKNRTGCLPGQKLRIQLRPPPAKVICE